jgi:hypothetical protein
MCPCATSCAVLYISATSRPKLKYDVEGHPQGNFCWSMSTWLTFFITRGIMIFVRLQLPVGKLVRRRETRTSGCIKCGWPFDYLRGKETQQPDTICASFLPQILSHYDRYESCKELLNWMMSYWLNYVIIDHDLPVNILDMPPFTGSCLLFCETERFPVKMWCFHFHLIDT